MENKRFSICRRWFPPLFAAFLLLVGCTKDESPGFTGVWSDGATTFYFYDDSRFKQSDKPGEQWIWEQKPERVLLHGNPERVWQVLYFARDSACVDEGGSFCIVRQ